MRDIAPAYYEHNEGRLRAAAVAYLVAGIDAARELLPHIIEFSHLVTTNTTNDG